MSFTLGFYDLFSNLVPGILGLYIINDFFRVFNLGYIDLDKIDSGAEVALLAILAYLVGHLISAVSYEYWLRLLVRKNADAAALSRLKAQNPGVHIDFRPSDGKLLISVIQHNNLELSQVIERVRSSSIMLRNISLVLILFSILQVMRLFIEGFSAATLVSAIALGALSVFSARRAAVHLRWFYRDVFKEALNYGTTLNDVLACSRAKTHADPKPVLESDPQFE